MDEINTLVFRTDRLGDFLISCPFILSYKKNYKNNKINVVTSEYNNDYIKKFKFIDNVISLKNEYRFFPKLVVLLKIIFKLRKIKFDKIIILDGKKRSFFISLFLKGSKYILLQSNQLRLLSKFFKYKYVVNYEIQSQLKNFSYLANLNDFNIEDKKPNIYDNYSFDKEFKFQNKYLIIHLDEKWFSQFYYKDFTDIKPNEIQIDRFIRKIVDQTKSNFDIVITTGFKKTIIDDYFQKNYSKKAENIYENEIKNKKIMYISNTTFNQIENIIKNSSLLICCEGAVSHVSHFFNVKTIALYEKKRLEHIKYWTGHMEACHLYERMQMEDLLSDNNFFQKIQKVVSF